MWIRNMDLDPELFVSEPDPGKNEEKIDKKSKYYFKFALIVQKYAVECWLKVTAVSCFLFLIDYKAFS